MSAIETLLRGLDDAWAHKWESLTGTLAGVAEEEAAWQAPCYAAEEPEAGWPLPGTTLWQVAHLAHCKRYYAAVVRSRGREKRPEPAPRAPLTSLGEERAALEAAHREERAAIQACRDDEMGTSVGGGMTLGEFLAMAIRHDTWHASQIAIARRLWRTRA